MNTERLSRRRGGIIAGLLCAGFMAFLGLMILGVVVAHSVRIRTDDGANGRDFSLDTPGGRLNIRTRDHMNPSLTGVPIYPGAWRHSGSGGANIQWSSRNGDDKSFYVIGGEYRTNDSARDVVEFYRKQLPNFMIVSEKNHSTDLEYREGGIKRIISITEKNGETRIGVASIGGGESN